MGLVGQAQPQDLLAFVVHCPDTLTFDDGHGSKEARTLVEYRPANQEAKF